ncbi:hypothetical protein LTR15_001126 [Elasticomyces elasticus]|nr:hypothetical protein LTR15_001126 [Elasticomyces elasticus]
MERNYDKAMDEGISSLLGGLSIALTFGRFTDFTVRLGDRTWNVHKIVMFNRSDFFEGHCRGGFKASDYPKEAAEGVVKLHDDDPESIDKMIDFIYSNFYDDTIAGVSPVLFNVRMIAIAEKYGVDHLANLAISKVDYHSATAWATDGFADAIEEAYTTLMDIDRTLRDTLLDWVMVQGDYLFDVTRKEHTYFQAMAAGTPMFTAEVAARFAKTQGIRRRITTYKYSGSMCPITLNIKIKMGQCSSWYCSQCTWNGTLSYLKWLKYRTVPEDNVLEGREDSESDEEVEGNN